MSSLRDNYKRGRMYEFLQEKIKPNLRLIDGNELMELIYEYYEQFYSRYKGLLPLKRVYVPAPIQEEE